MSIRPLSALVVFVSIVCGCHAPNGSAANNLCRPRCFQPDDYCCKCPPSVATACRSTCCNDYRRKCGVIGWFGCYPRACDDYDRKCPPGTCGCGD